MPTSYPRPFSLFSDDVYMHLSIFYRQRYLIRSPCSLRSPAFSAPPHSRRGQDLALLQGVRFRAAAGARRTRARQSARLDSRAARQFAGRCGYACGSKSVGAMAEYLRAPHTIQYRCVFIHDCLCFTRNISPAISASMGYCFTGFCFLKFLRKFSHPLLLYAPYLLNSFHPVIS
jgi:hypothetical protein